MLEDSADPPATFDPVAARKWKPWKYGPPEQWLRCEGRFLARVVTYAHYHWPWDRGQWRFMHLLSKSRRLQRRLRKVLFRSSCGVPVELDITTQQFLFLSGRLSPEPLEIAVASRLVRPGDVFVDVGAHWGLYILHILGMLGGNGTYYAIEPSGSNFRFLRDAFSNTDVRLKLFEMAVSEFNGKGNLIEEGTLNGHLGETQAGSVPVQVSRLDSLLRDVPLEGGRVFIKADTEGHEAAVIRSCKGLADAGIRPIFLLEFLTERFGQTRADIVDAVAATFGSGYSYWAIDDERGCLMRFERPDEPGPGIRNALAIPAESLDRISSCPHAPTVQ